MANTQGSLCRANGTHHPHISEAHEAIALGYFKIPLLSSLDLNPKPSWTFEGPPGTRTFTIRGTGAETVLRELEILLPGWRPVPNTVVSRRSVTVEIREDPHEYRLAEDSGGSVEIALDSFSAAYHITTRLFETLAESLSLGMVLHAGAVVTNAGVIAFSAPATTGKSVLGAAFSLAGDRILGDDRIVVHTIDSHCEVLPLGLAQKLRLPLPDPLAETFAPLIVARPGKRIAGSQFLSWDKATQIRAGATLPLAGIVLLVRDGTSPPRLTTQSKPEAIHEILTLSGTPGGANSHLAAARALVENVPVSKLHYGSCFEARDAILGDVARLGD